MRCHYGNMTYLAHYKEGNFWDKGGHTTSFLESYTVGLVGTNPETKGEVTVVSNKGGKV